VAQFFEECRQNYSWIVVDAPPIASVTDSLLLAKLVDSVLLVVRYNEVDRKLARRCLNSLRKTEASLAGVVLNGVDPRQDSYHRYYGYYQEKAEPEAKVTRFRRNAAS
jgi:Mrp family chromosome partitioning ATPase